jgi:hypothetical protein
MEHYRTLFKYFFYIVLGFSTKLCHTLTVALGALLLNAFMSDSQPVFLGVLPFPLLYTMSLD